MGCAVEPLSGAALCIFSSWRFAIARPRKISDEHLRELGFAPHSFDELMKKDPTYGYLETFAAASWQNPANYSGASTTVTLTPELFTLPDIHDLKASDKNWRNLQKLCYKYCKTFGPLRASVDSKAAMVAGTGFRVSSPVLDIHEFLHDLFYHPRNGLYRKVRGWIWRMLSVCECFLLVVFDEQGNATIRALDEERIGEGEESGLIVDPDDATATLFYAYKGLEEVEWIPDVRFIYEPEELIKIRLKNLGEKFEKDKISKDSTLSSKHKALGGYRRFVIHWKNFTGIDEILRDTAAVSTTLEWINLYIQALKWQMDYKRALSAYTIVLGFGNIQTGETTTEGRVAAAKWLKMTQAEKDATGLTSPLSPGSKVWLMPGMTLKIEAPNLPKLAGDNKDLIDLAGSGARTPMDLWQGQSAGMPYAAVKATRAPLTMEIEDIQGALENFLRHCLLPICMIAKIKQGTGKFRSLADVVDLKSGTDYTLMPSYPIEWPDTIKGGKVTTKTVNVEPWHEELLAFEWPQIALTDKPDQEANARLGSKHGGTIGLGESQSSAGKRLGIQNFDRERKIRAMEDAKYGEPKRSDDAKLAQPGGGQPGSAAPADTPPADKNAPSAK